ncbi:MULTISPECIES: flavin monoamine oxidase family protein [Microbacterium]|uniref:flavin monoamine oxidase family protein n=1 Tax=Microbacterium TaxID=33882 RepID=UPI00217D8574|nr:MULTISPECIES: FAD-dependent oxidoreductase [Microbacterium]UWF77693.1 FAD-dependent oxidoreductase [Microbacterium neungamense]WCM55862.1 FAD-dependent oxidoreductase [Microbacterium sp. EF45047]
MSITRRTLLVGAGVGAVSVLLASCTGEPAPSASPRPTATRTSSPGPTPPPAPGAVPRPAGLARSRWSADPYARGSMSYIPAGGDPQHREALAAPVGDRLFFAGEATDAGRPATVLGAVDSGRRAAEAAIEVAGDEERIAVVGAGVAGAVAGRVLADAGHRVTVLEARDRIGGRIHSVIDDDWPLPVQLGAWLTVQGQADALRDRLLDLGIGEIAFDSATGWSAEGPVPPVDGAVLEGAIAQAQQQPADSPLTDALIAVGADLQDPALVAALAWLEATTGADASRASTRHPPAFLAPALTGADGDVGALVAEAAKDLDVALGAPVVRIVHDEEGVSLRLGTGESQSFDRVIVTVPLGVLKTDGIEFDPELPFEHRSAISLLASGAVETVWLRFDEPFWDAGAAIWHIVGGDGPIRTWLNLEIAIGEPILVGLVGGPDAVGFAALGDREAEDAARASLAFVAPDPA